MHALLKKHALLKTLWVLPILVVLLAQPAMAVTIVTAEMPFDAVGQRAQNSARNVWAPAIVTIALVALAVIVIMGAQRLAGVSVRTAIGIGILAIAITGAGLATLFPGITTSVILP